MKKTINQLLTHLFILCLFLFVPISSINAQIFSCQKQFDNASGTYSCISVGCPSGWQSFLTDGTTCEQYDVNGSSSSKCPEGTFVCKKPGLCTPDEVWCDGSVLKRCNFTGDDLLFETDCSNSGKICNQTTLNCEEVDPTADCSLPGVCNPACGTGLTCRRPPKTASCGCYPTGSGGAGGTGGSGWGGSPTGLLIDLDSLINTTLGNLGFKFTGTNSNLGAIVTGSLNILYAFAGVGLLFYIIRCGFGYLTSGGDPKKAEAARACLTSSITGFVLVIAAFWITQIVNYIFGLGGTFN